MADNGEHVEVPAKLKPKNGAFEDLVDHENLGRGSSEEKETPVDDDLIPLFDSQDGHRPKVAKKGKFGGGAGGGHKIFNRWAVELAQRLNLLFSGLDAINQDGDIVVFGLGHYNALAYGVKNDGWINPDDCLDYTGTDNADAFANLVAIIKANGGGTLFLPPGKYLSSSFPKIDFHTFGLEGAGFTFNNQFGPTLIEGTSTLIYIGQDSVTNAAAKEVDISKVFVRCGPTPVAGWDDVDLALCNSSGALNKPFSGFAMSSYEIDDLVTVVPSPGHEAHSGEVYKVLQAIPRGSAPSYYPPWDYPAVFEIQNRAPKVSQAKNPGPVYNLRLENLVILGGVANTGPWQNRVCQNNAARVLEIKNCPRFKLRNVRLAHATDACFQLGGLQEFPISTGCQGASIAGLSIENMESVGIGWRIGEYLSDAEIAAGKRSDSFYKAQVDDVNIAYGFQVTDNTKDANFLGPVFGIDWSRSKYNYAAAAAELAAGRVPGGSNPECGWEICHADHVEFNNCAVYTTGWGAVPGLKIAGMTAQQVAGVDALTFRKFSGSAKVCGSASTYRQRDGAVKHYAAGVAEQTMCASIRVVDHNTGNGGSDFFDRDPDAIQLYFDRNDSLGQYGLHLIGPLEGQNAAIGGTTQVCAGQYTIEAAIGNFSRAGFDILGLSGNFWEVLPPVGIGSCEMTFDLVDADAPANNGTYTTRLAPGGYATYLPIKEQLSSYSHSTSKAYPPNFWELGAHTVTLTFHPTLYLDNHNEAVLTLEPWMSPSHPLKIVPPADNTACRFTLTVKQNGTNTGVWPGWETDTASKIKWIGQAMTPPTSSTPIVVLDIIFHAGVYLITVVGAGGLGYSEGQINGVQGQVVADRNRQLITDGSGADITAGTMAAEVFRWEKTGSQNYGGNAGLHRFNNQFVNSGTGNIYSFVFYNDIYYQNGPGVTSNHWGANIKAVANGGEITASCGVRYRPETSGSGQIKKANVTLARAPVGSGVSNYRAHEAEADLGSSNHFLYDPFNHNYLYHYLTLWDAQVDNDLIVAGVLYGTEVRFGSGQNQLKLLPNGFTFGTYCWLNPTSAGFQIFGPSWTTSFLFSAEHLTALGNLMPASGSDAYSLTYAQKSALTGGATTSAADQHWNPAIKCSVRGNTATSWTCDTAWHKITFDVGDRVPTTHFSLSSDNLGTVNGTTYYCSFSCRIDTGTAGKLCHVRVRKVNGGSTTTVLSGYYVNTVSDGTNASALVSFVDRAISMAAGDYIYVEVTTTTPGTNTVTVTNATLSLERYL